MSASRAAVVADDGRVLDAHYELDSRDGTLAVMVHSRSGSVAAGNARNSDYLVGLEILLRRLHAMGANLLDAYVNSSEAASLPLSIRRLAMPHFPYPVDLAAVDDIGLLRREMTRAQTTAGRPPGVSPIGGNPTKKIRLVTDVQASNAVPTLAALGGVGAAAGNPTAPVVLPTATQAPRGRVGGQGYEADKAVRQAVEAHAMEEAEKRLTANGWRCVDTSATYPFDFMCVRGAERLIVEVKGTRSSGASVHVTAGEVREARRWAPASALYVHSNIRVQRRPDGSVVAEGGDGVWHSPWVPADEHLAPTDFTYSVPRDGTHGSGRIP